MTHRAIRRHEPFIRRVAKVALQGALIGVVTAGSALAQDAEPAGLDALIERGEEAFEADDLNGAAAAFTSAHADAKEDGDVVAQARAAAGLGSVEMVRGRHENAGAILSDHHAQVATRIAK